MGRQRAPIANTILKNTVQGLMLPDIKTYHEATVIKTVWNWHIHIKKDKSVEQNTELSIDTHKYTHLTFYKGTR